MSKVGSNRLYLCLENLNDCIINEMQNRPSENLSEEQIEKVMPQRDLEFDEKKITNSCGAGTTEPSKREQKKKIA